MKQWQVGDAILARICKTTKKAGSVPYRIFQKEGFERDATLFLFLETKKLEEKKGGIFI